jgi:hypothetical protein
MNDPNYAQPHYPPQPQHPHPAYGHQPQTPYAQPGFTPRHKLPGTVIAASIMWIIYGGLGLLGNIGTLASTGGKMGTGGIVGIGITLAFLIAGIQTLMGKAKGTLGNGIASIVVGGLVLIAFLALGSLFRGIGPGAGVLMAIGLIVGGILITAGILGCMGNKAYKEYRATKGL